MAFVLDASLTLARCLRDEQNPLADRLFDRLSEEEALAPAIWPLEVANGLAVAIRKGRLSASDAVSASEALERLPIRVAPTSLRDALGPILDAARERGLSAYDASYLLLAMRERLPLATGDGALRQAAEAAGVPLLA
jgi:predicted nucleic acid-binding protein